MRSVIKRFDRFLRRRLEILEFTQDPECLLRLRLIHARREVRFDDHIIRLGAPLLELHLWNERLPIATLGGAGLAYGVDARRLMLKSLRLVAQELSCNPQLSGALAVYGLTGLIDAGATTGGEKLAQRLGFCLLPYQPPLGRFGEFLEYVYARALVWAYNPAGLRSLRFSKFRRTEIWMLKEELLRRFLEPGNC